MGPRNVRYAAFRNRVTSILIPEYDLTPETRKAIDEIHKGWYASFDEAVKNGEAWVN